MLLKDELLAETGIGEDMLSDWEKMKLVKADGVTSDGVPFYSRATLDRILGIKELQGVGYGLDDIQRIIKKVGLPGSHVEEGKPIKGNEFLTVGGLAERVGVSVRTIKHWEDKGIIEPDMRSEGRFRLYSEIFVYICQLIKDLQLFSYSLEEIKTLSDLSRDFLVLKDNIEAGSVKNNDQKLEDMLLNIKGLNEKIGLFKAGIDRWEELLKKKRKEILALKNLNNKRKTSRGKKSNE